MNSKSAIRVEEWVASLPSRQSTGTNSMGPTVTPQNQTNSPLRKNMRLNRDASFQSDGSSHSVESVLEFRRPDPEDVLIGLGFGVPHAEANKCRIPERFLQPSKVWSLV